MAKHKIKRFNPNEEKPIEIDTFFEKSKKTVKDFFVKTPSSTKKKNLRAAYLIFNLEEISVKYGITCMNVLFLLYLKELGLFGKRIYILDRPHRTYELSGSGFIVKDYSQSKTELFRLSDKGNAVCDDFNSSIKDAGRFMSVNRKTDANLEDKVKGVLASYFE